MRDFLISQIIFRVPINKTRITSIDYKIDRSEKIDLFASLRFP